MILVAALLAVLAAMALMTFRTVSGPTTFDRLLAANSIGNGAILIVALYGFLTDRPDFLDLTLTYALLNYVGVFAVLKFFRAGSEPDEQAEDAVMTDVLSTIVSGILIIVGAGFFLTGAIGFIRMPDLFTRLHAASLSDTTGMAMILSGLAVHAGFGFAAIKLVFLIMLLLFMGPATTHALAAAALAAGIKPLGSQRRPARKGAPDTADKTAAKEIAKASAQKASKPLSRKGKRR